MERTLGTRLLGRQSSLKRARPGNWYATRETSRTQTWPRCIRAFTCRPRCACCCADAFHRTTARVVETGRWALCVRVDVRRTGAHGRHVGQRARNCSCECAGGRDPRNDCGSGQERRFALCREMGRLRAVVEHRRSTLRRCAHLMLVDARRSWGCLSPETTEKHHCRHATGCNPQFQQYAAPYPLSRLSRLDFHESVP